MNIEFRQGSPCLVGDGVSKIEDWIASVSVDFNCADFTINREGDVIDTRTGEIDQVLTAQYGMGIW